MNWGHFQTFVWLRWRLFLNQARRGGVVNAVLQAVLIVFSLLIAAGVSVAAFFVGLFALADVSPAVVLYVWDGVVVAFLFTWAMRVLIELQRSEALSIDRFLHLPVSLTGVYLINYFSSFVNLSLIIFVPGTFALALGLALGRGPMMLLTLPALAGFFLMVTAVTYQFQGWLAALMVNKRRRRTVIVVVTAAFIVLCQAPNLINVWRPWEREGQDQSATRFQEQQNELQRSFAAGEIGPEEYQRRQSEAVHDYQAKTEEANREAVRQVEGVFRVVNLALPPGWLPLAAQASAEGNALPALLAALGLGTIGAASLWRSYRTTVRLYTGQFQSGKRRQAAAAAPAATLPAKPAATMLEWRLPWLSEQASAVALGGLRSLTRAPEAKMMLLTPVLLVLVFGALFFTKSFSTPAPMRPLMAFGAMGLILLNMVQIVGNQFGFDRSGFRAFVLSAAPRRDILLGKNLASAPLALGLGAVLVVALQFFSPMSLDAFLAFWPQAVSMYLLFCLLANCLSILAPMAIRAGSMKPANPKGTAFLLQFGFIFLLPWLLSLTLWPLGVAFLLNELGSLKGVPVALILSLLECAAVVLVYNGVLGWEGRLLQAREQKLLELITLKTE